PGRPSPRGRRGLAEDARSQPHHTAASYAVYAAARPPGGRAPQNPIPSAQAARPAARNSTSATLRYATGGRSHAWMLFGPAARTAPVATAYKPAASSGNARITQLALITPETDRMSPNAASNSSISAGISSSMVG